MIAEWQEILLMIKNVVIKKKLHEDCINRTNLIFFAIEDQDICDEEWLTDLSIPEDVGGEKNA